MSKRKAKSRRILSTKKADSSRFQTASHSNAQTAESHELHIADVKNISDKSSVKRKHQHENEIWPEKSIGWLTFLIGLIAATLAICFTVFELNMPFLALFEGIMLCWISFKAGREW